MWLAWFRSHALPWPHTVTKERAHLPATARARHGPHLGQQPVLGCVDKITGNLHHIYKAELLQENTLSFLFSFGIQCVFSSFFFPPKPFPPSPSPPAPNLPSWRAGPRKTKQKTHRWVLSRLWLPCAYLSCLKKVNQSRRRLSEPPCPWDLDSSVIRWSQ